MPSTWPLSPAPRQRSSSPSSGPAERRRRRLSPTAVLGAGFAAGAIPFSGLAAHLVAGVDLRKVGSGTVSGTGLYEHAGFTPLAEAPVA